MVQGKGVESLWNSGEAARAQARPVLWSADDAALGVVHELCERDQFR